MQIKVDEHSVLNNGAIDFCLSFMFSEVSTDVQLFNECSWCFYSIWVGILQDLLGSGSSLTKKSPYTHHNLW